MATVILCENFFRTLLHVHCVDVEVPFVFALRLAEGNHCTETIVRETSKATKPIGWVSPILPIYSSPMECLRKSSRVSFTSRHRRGQKGCSLYNGETIEAAGKGWVV